MAPGMSPSSPSPAPTSLVSVICRQRQPRGGKSWAGGGIAK
eukprot:CAMPEP_0197899328 /NCGR_PEP_ID=MMETSP1439-20131203/46231_1 /TAXON_ID=66791 /ORGANISM="Gonyaulax spinifera, Strain CCMP409" /LENGTH=40 /DNA_ID= /DNA_START= /DNA_END= /DNA_ORIENTATION=